MNSFRWQRAAGLALLTVVAGLAGCGAPRSSPLDTAQGELDRNRRTWEALGSEDYRYVGRRGCFCPPDIYSPVIVEVRGGEVVSRTYQEDGRAVSEEHAELWPALPGVFDLVQDAIDREAADVAVAYDPDTGVPRTIRIDYDEMMADEELGYEVEGFEPLQPQPAGAGG